MSQLSPTLVLATLKGTAAWCSVLSAMDLALMQQIFRAIRALSLHVIPNSNRIRPTSPFSKDATGPLQPFLSSLMLKHIESARNHAPSLMVTCSTEYAIPRLRSRIGKLFSRTCCKHLAYPTCRPDSLLSSVSSGMLNRFWNSVSNRLRQIQWIQLASNWPDGGSLATSCKLLFPRADESPGGSADPVNSLGGGLHRKQIIHEVTTGS